MTTKFTGIHFPFFGLKVKPYNIEYHVTGHITLTKFKDGKVYLLDDVKLDSSSYSERLLRLDSQHSQTRLVFDFTFNNLRQLIKSADKVKWGLDSRGQVFNLSKKFKYKAKIAKVKRKNDNLLWIDGITYPFTLPYPIDNFKSQDLYAILVNIENTWYIKDFTHEKKYINDIKL